jgi:poly-gamma-glutamate capsule biosynthesis protein CapA/YwtB (metallophosphatase superfamily)
MARRRLVPLCLLLCLAVAACTSQPPPTGAPTSTPSPATAPTDVPTSATPDAAPSAPEPTSSASLPGSSASPQPTPSPTTPSATSTPGGRVRLIAVGDVMLARTIGRRIESDGPLAPWEGVVDTFAEADVVFANLECTISTRGTPANKSFTFRAPLAAADSVAAAGIDVVSLANNHAIDWGVPALRDTIAALDSRGVGHVGAGEDADQAHAPVIVEQNGLRIAFLAYVASLAERTGFVTRQWAAGPDEPGLAIARPGLVARDVTAARAMADIVIVSLHGGRENRREPSKPQRNVAQAALEAGAALVLGHHPHVLQGYERADNTLVAYSLGNFVFDLFGARANDSVILDVTLTAAGVSEVRWIPVIVRNGFPHLAEGEDAERILGRIVELS